MHVLTLLLNTVLLRPYVFVFLAAFLFASIVNFGLYRTLTFLGVVWVVAFWSEFSSTRNGFPYGFYHYTEATRGQELFISNVPFMDSLSYSFLLFASYSMALLAVSPLYVRALDVQTLPTLELRTSKKVLILTAVFMMMIDVVIDPVALQGEKWFLGRIYYYDYQGHYFGVPLSNALGWGLVGFAATWIYQRIDSHFFRSKPFIPGARPWFARGLYGVGLYYGVLVFNLAITAYIREWGLFIAGCFIFLFPTLFLIVRILDPRVRATETEWKNFMEASHVLR